MAKTIFIISVIVGLLAIGFFYEEERKKRTLKTKPNVDLTKYTGRWYEIARKPIIFEKNVYCNKADYELVGKNMIKVVNTGRKSSITGEVVRFESRAWPIEDSNSKLKLEIFWPISADYYIIDLADDYSWAIVGEPYKISAWILARDPELPPNII